MRATLSPSFTSSKIKGMFFLISECAENFIDYFLQKHEEIIVIDVKDITTRFTNDVIATTAFGIKCDSLRNRNNEFYVMGKEATDLNTIWKSIKFFITIFLPKIACVSCIVLYNQFCNSIYIFYLLDIWYRYI